MRNLRTSRRLAWIGVPLVPLIALVAFWNWDWFIPIVQSRASAAIGRPVTIAHLHLRLGRVVTVAADGVVVANPPDWSNGDPPFVSIKSLTIQADAWGYVRGNGLIMPVIEIDAPRVLAAETKDGAANFRLSTLVYEGHYRALAGGATIPGAAQASTDNSVSRIRSFRFARLRFQSGRSSRGPGIWVRLGNVRLPSADLRLPLSIPGEHAQPQKQVAPTTAVTVP